MPGKNAKSFLTLYRVVGKGLRESIEVIFPTISHALGHPCLVSLLFMASLYSTLFDSQNFYLLVEHSYEEIALYNCKGNLK